ncbi:PEGA domain-containing protein [Patescibacteria group bacterium]|nr:PEGA domain-containing protein [Patescibacteria group bacterium]
MNIRTRRIIALIFIGIFFVSAPILILYTAGFRYDIKKGGLEKTGALVIETTPRGATVTLNGQPENTKTPVRLNNVLPDDYEISVEKDGYYSWSKKLSVLSRETTFAEDIVLFAKNDAEKLVENKIERLDFSPQKKFAVYSTASGEGYELFLLDLGNQKTKSLLSGEQPFKNPTSIWANDATKFLFLSKENAIVFSTTFFKQSSDLFPYIIENDLTDFKWDIGNDEILFARSGNSVYKINAALNRLEKPELIFQMDDTKKLFDFFIFENEIYTIERIQTKNILTKYPLKNGAANKISKSIELKNENYKFDSVYRNLLAVKNNENNYYFVNLELDNIVLFKNNIQKMELFNNELLLIQTDQELSFLNLANGDISEKTIARYSQGLQNSAWHKSANYVFALQENKISIIEMDDRNGHFAIEIPLSAISDFAVDAKCKTIFYLQNNYLWKLAIQ